MAEGRGCKGGLDLLQLAQTMCLTAVIICLLTAPCHASSRKSSFSLGCPRLRCSLVTADLTSCGTSAGHPGNVIVDILDVEVVGLCVGGLELEGCG
jgi:hypothetical protein